MTEPSSAAAPPAQVPAPGGAATVVLVLLEAYKLIFSPFFGGACRFHPSCSTYMAEAVRTHGAVSGTWMGLRRIAGCRPFGRYGFDPVPHKH